MDLNIRFFYKTVFNSQNEMYYSGSIIYKNRAVKRVMFDGGYATFDAASVSGWHYFLYDHAGSVRRSRRMGARRADKPLLPLRADSQAVVGASGISPAPALATRAPFQAPLQLRVTI